MLKFRAADILGLGLSHENLRRLRDGKPITFPVSDVGGLEGVARIMIFAGETEDTMQQELVEHFELTPETEIRRGDGSPDDFHR